ncbi:GNAT family N-acetyltransferase [bacterium]|nr:GNAT family N-acetyltransferase [bacterium]
MTSELKELTPSDGREIFDMLKEIGPGENGFVNSGYDVEYVDFPAYLQRHANMAKGIGIDLTRYVPQTMYWLYVDGRPVGIGKLRHYLNDYLMKIGGHIGYAIRPSERGKGYGTLILKELLIKAREKGIEEALVTCREDNIRSRKIIERNGGKLADITDAECRYWIP